MFESIDNTKKGKEHEELERLEAEERASQEKIAAAQRSIDEALAALRAAEGGTPAPQEPPMGSIDADDLRADIYQKLDLKTLGSESWEKTKKGVKEGGRMIKRNPKKTVAMAILATLLRFGPGIIEKAQNFFGDKDESRTEETAGATTPKGIKNQTATSKEKTQQTRRPSPVSQEPEPGVAERKAPEPGEEAQAPVEKVREATGETQAVAPEAPAVAQAEPSSEAKAEIEEKIRLEKVKKAGFTETIEEGKKMWVYKYSNGKIQKILEDGYRQEYDETGKLTNSDLMPKELIKEINEKYGFQIELENK